jgi:hypothetical protein
MKEVKFFTQGSLALLFGDISCLLRFPRSELTLLLPGLGSFQLDS